MAFPGGGGKLAKDLRLLGQHPAQKVVAAPRDGCKTRAVLGRSR